jgi:hypothetical protein
VPTATIPRTHHSNRDLSATRPANRPHLQHRTPHSGAISPNGGAFVKAGSAETRLPLADASLNRAAHDTTVQGWIKFAVYLGGRFPTFSGAMLRFCSGNLQTAEKPSLFPLSCCDTRQNTSQPKTHCRCVSGSSS